MANSDLVTLVVTTAATFLQYMLPLIGVMTGLVFIFSWLHSITIGAARHTFRG